MREHNERLALPACHGRRHARRDKHSAIKDRRTPTQDAGDGSILWVGLLHPQRAGKFFRIAILLARGGLATIPLRVPQRVRQYIYTTAMSDVELGLAER